MRWLEVSVQCDGEAAEAVCELFYRSVNSAGDAQTGAVVEVGGFDAVGELHEPIVTVRTYLQMGKTHDARLKKIEEGLWFLSRLYPIPEPTFRELLEQDWATAWQAHYKPIPVGHRLLIVPQWQAQEVLAALGAAEDGAPRLPIILDPGMAFGTGMHPSTRLCLAALERHIQPGEAMLDVGCGSGILSIAGARLGASRVLATDTDPIAVAATQENSRHNGLEQVIHARQGSLPQIEEQPTGWPVTVANILADVIVELLAGGLAKLLAPEGCLILGGIIQPAVGQVEAALDRRGLKVVERTVEGDWVSLVAAFR